MPHVLASSFRNQPTALTLQDLHYVRDPVYFRQVRILPSASYFYAFSVHSYCSLASYNTVYPDRWLPIFRWDMWK